MKKIVKMAVWYENGTMEYWRGTGAVTDVKTYVPRGAPNGEDDLPTRYLTAQLTPSGEQDE
jgi:hypothetical protein